MNLYTKSLPFLFSYYFEYFLPFFARNDKFFFFLMQWNYYYPIRGSSICENSFLELPMLT